MTRTLFYHDLPLPPLRNGHVWGIRFHPCGRQELRQCVPSDLVFVSDALDRLCAGYSASVWLDDEVRIVNQLSETTKEQAT